MPEFLSTLIVGCVILFILVLAFGGVLPEMRYSGTGYAVAKPMYDRIVLAENDLVSMTMFKIADSSETVSNGNGNHSTIEEKFSSDPEWYNDGLLELDVLYTNGYGQLKVTLNGHELYRGYLKEGDHEIRFDENLLKAGDNVLRIETTGPGFRFWERSEYELTARLYGIVEEKIERNFFMDTAKDARLVVDFGRRRGAIMIRLNGDELYNDKVESDVLVFNIAKNQLGKKNTVEFIPAARARFDIEFAELVTKK